MSLINRLQQNQPARAELPKGKDRCQKCGSPTNETLCENCYRRLVERLQAETYEMLYRRR